MSSERSASFTAECRTGRLVEARVHALWTREDADAYSQELGRLILSQPRHPTPVLCADHRPVAVYPPAVTDRLVELFQQMNTRLERIAIIVSSTNALMYLQLERLVREAGFDKRRVFQDSTLATRHLEQGLDAREVARLRQFLGEWPRPTGVLAP